MKIIVFLAAFLMASQAFAGSFFISAQPEFNVIQAKVPVGLDRFLAGGGLDASFEAAEGYFFAAGAHYWAGSEDFLDVGFLAVTAGFELFPFSTPGRAGLSLDLGGSYNLLTVKKNDESVYYAKGSFWAENDSFQNESFVNGFLGARINSDVSDFGLVSSVFVRVFFGLQPNIPLAITSGFSIRVLFKDAPKSEYNSSVEVVAAAEPEPGSIQFIPARLPGFDSEASARLEAAGCSQDKADEFLALARDLYASGFQLADLEVFIISGGTVDDLKEWGNVKKDGNAAFYLQQVLELRRRLITPAQAEKFALFPYEGILELHKFGVSPDLAACFGIFVVHGFTADDLTGFIVNNVDLLLARDILSARDSFGNTVFAARDVRTLQDIGVRSEEIARHIAAAEKHKAVLLAAAAGYDDFNPFVFSACWLEIDKGGLDLASAFLRVSHPDGTPVFTDTANLIAARTAGADLDLINKFAVISDPPLRGDRIRKYIQYGISPELVASGFKCKDPSKPRALIILADSDWNNAFSNTCAYGLTGKIAGSYNLRLYFASTENEVYDLLSKQKNIALFVLGGHGSREALWLGDKDLVPDVKDDELLSIDTTDFEFKPVLVSAMAPRGRIFLDSCSNGEGGSHARDNLCHFIARLSGKKVMASTLPFGAAQAKLTSIFPFELEINIGNSLIATQEKEE